MISLQNNVNRKNSPSKLGLSENKFKTCRFDMSSDYKNVEISLKSIRALIALLIALILMLFLTYFKTILKFLLLAMIIILLIWYFKTKLVGKGL
jgi:hypothetical protein